MNNKREIRSFAIQRFMENENELSRGKESKEISALDVVPPDPKPAKPLKPKVAVTRSAAALRETAEEVRKVGAAQRPGAENDEAEDILAVALRPSASKENRLSLILPDVDKFDFKSIQNAGGTCHQPSLDDTKLNLIDQFENITDRAEEVEREQVFDGDQEKMNQHLIHTLIGNDSSNETKVSKINNKKTTRAMEVHMDENSYPYFVLPAVASSPIFTRYSTSV